VWVKYLLTEVRLRSLLLRRQLAERIGLSKRPGLLGLCKGLLLELVLWYRLEVGYGLLMLAIHWLLVLLDRFKEIDEVWSWTLSFGL
jgi:hypothetical protein